MQAIEAFRIAPGIEPGANGTLLFGHHPIADLSARLVEAQFALDDGGYLVLATLDSPYEEELTILCLDADLRERDRLSIGQPYTPGLLQEVQLLGPARLRFRFVRPEPWMLDIAPRRQLLGIRTKWLHLK